MRILSDINTEISDLQMSKMWGDRADRKRGRVMMSRVEELQRMCDSINENGGLDSEQWHTALLAQIAQNLAVIADVMMADRKDKESE